MKKLQLVCCGGCHAWGCDPVIKDSKCTGCDRTEAQIKALHGFVRFADIAEEEVELKGLSPVGEERQSRYKISNLGK